MATTPRLIGTDTLPKFDVHARDLRRELDKVFCKFENFFALNRLVDGNGAATNNDNAKLMADLLRQYIGDDTLDAIYPLSTDRTKTYAELKAAIEAKFKPTYSENHVRKQFFHCTMLEGQTSRAFLQECWSAIRRTSCADPAEQLHWVLACFTARHTNAEVRQVFDLKPPKTEEEALQIADDVESRQRERTTSAKVAAVLQSSNETNGSARGRGGQHTVRNSWSFWRWW
jgi:hypothetical protein